MSTLERLHEAINGARYVTGDYSSATLSPRNRRLPIRAGPRSRGKASSVVRNRSRYPRGAGETCLIKQRKNSQGLPLPAESLAFLKAAVK
jgi:hypothetical protein